MHTITVQIESSNDENPDKQFYTKLAGLHVNYGNVPSHLIAELHEKMKAALNDVLYNFSFRQCERCKDWYPNRLIWYGDDGTGSAMCRSCYAIDKKIF